MTATDCRSRFFMLEISLGFACNLSCSQWPGFGWRLGQRHRLQRSCRSAERYPEVLSGVRVHLQRQHGVGVRSHPMRFHFWQIQNLPGLQRHFSSLPTKLQFAF